MSNRVFKLNKPGLTRIMKSAEMQGVLNTAASRISAAAGDGFSIETAHPITFVSIASVRTASFKARLRNRRDDVLKKARDSVKL